MTIPLFVPYPTLAFAPILLANQVGYLQENSPTIELKMGFMDHYQHILEGSEPGIVPLMSFVVRAYNRGAQPLVFSAVFNQVVHRIVAKKEISNLADLRGRVVMVNVFGGTSDLEARFVLRKAGVRLEDVSFVEAGADLEMAQLEALRRGEVDAIASSAPFWYVAEREGFHVLGDVSTHYAKWSPVVLAAERDWLTSQPSLPTNLRVIIQEAVNFLTTRPQEALSALAGVIPELTAEVGVPLIARMRSAWDTSISAEGLQAYVDEFAAEFHLRAPRVSELVASP